MELRYTLRVALWAGCTLGGHPSFLAERSYEKKYGARSRGGDGLPELSAVSVPWKMPEDGLGSQFKTDGGKPETKKVLGLKKL